VGTVVGTTEEGWMLLKTRYLKNKFAQVAVILYYAMDAGKSKRN
jgi:hypothetical protein